MFSTLQKIATKKIFLVAYILWAIFTILSFLPQLQFECYLIWINPAFLYLIIAPILLLLQIASLGMAIIKPESRLSRPFFLISHALSMVSNIFIVLFDVVPINISPSVIIAALTVGISEGLILLLMALACYKKRVWTIIACIFILISLIVTPISLSINGITTYLYSNQQTILHQPLSENTLEIGSPFSEHVSSIHEIKIDNALEDFTVGSGTIILTPDEWETFSKPDHEIPTVTLPSSENTHTLQNPDMVIITMYTSPLSGLAMAASIFASLLTCLIHLLYLIRFIPQKRTIVDAAPLSAEERLQQLKDAHDGGHLTDEEYETKKAEILDSPQ